MSGSPRDRPGFGRPGRDRRADISTASSGGGGGLAYTGVAVVAVAGVGLLLFANGFGLMRLVRK